MADLRIDLLGGLNTAKTTAQINKDVQAVQDKIKGFDVAKITGLTTSYKKLKGQTELVRQDTYALVDSMGKAGKATLDANGELVNFTSTAKKASKSVKKLKTETDSAKKSTMTLAQQSVEAAKKFAVWSGITTLYFGAIKALKDMVQEVKNLDDAIVELSKVTDLSVEELKAFSETAKDVGESINATAADVVKASAEFSRMGFSEQTSMQLAEDAIVLTKIADGITKTTDASTAMIAILKGFNFQAEDSRHVIDSINEASNKFAINTDDLADGLRRVGGVMSQSNTTFEETIGLLIGANEGLQNIEKTSSGLEIKLAPYLRNLIRKFRERYCLTVCNQRLVFVGQ